MSSDIEKRMKAFSVGRFQVMALLQAARYYLVNKDINKAKSFGLNRAIFYAWAKHYGPHRYPVRLSRVEQLLMKRMCQGKPASKCSEGYIEVLGECVKEGARGYMIGEQEQTPYDYDQQVARKISRIIPYEKAWKTALEYISQFPEYVLKDPVKFYRYVYEPVRDTFFIQLAEKGKVEPPKEIIERLKALEEMMEKTYKKQKSIFDFTNE